MTTTKYIAGKKTIKLQMHDLLKSLLFYSTAKID